MRLFTIKQVVGVYKSMSSIDQSRGTRANAATVSHPQFPLKHTCRLARLQSYIVPALGRANLKVLTGAHVLRLIAVKQGDHVTLTDVEFQYGDRRFKVAAACEVILSAG